MTATNGVQKPGLEEAVIGSCLIDDAALEWAYYHVPEEHFADLRNRKLFEIIKRLKKSGSAVDFATVSNSMTAGEEKKTMGHLTEIVGSVQHSYNVRDYATLLRKQTSTRKLAELYEKVKSDPFDTETQKEIRSLWDSLSNEQQTIIPIKEAAHAYRGLLEERKSGKLARYLTGFPLLDQLTGGFLQGNLVIVGARTTIGKTSFLLNVALRMADIGRRVLFISAEMMFDELLDRLVPIVTHSTDDDGNETGPALTISRLRKGEVSSWESMNAALDNLSRKEFWCVEGGRMSMSRVRLAMEVTKPDVIFVDFIQRFTPPNYNINRAAYFSDVANELKNIAKEKRILVVAASQLNRGIEKDGRGDPQLSDYKESGGIEESADYSMMLAPKRSGLDTMRLRELTLHLNKSRNGPTGKIYFDMLKPRTYFSESLIQVEA